MEPIALYCQIIFIYWSENSPSPQSPPSVHSLNPNPNNNSIYPPFFLPTKCSYAPGTKAAGLLTTKITESPCKNILLTYRSLFVDVPLLRPFPPLEYSVHISFTSSSSLYMLVKKEDFVSKKSRHDKKKGLGIQQHNMGISSQKSRSSNKQRNSQIHMSIISLDPSQ